jgi:signal peptidase I
MKVYYIRCKIVFVNIWNIRRGSIAILDALEPVVLAFAIFMIVYLFLVQPHKVDGRSMYPNFEDQEYILTDKITYSRSLPKRGDVIVFHAPPPFTDDFLKRIVGMPGETIELRSGFVYINGKKLDEVYLPTDFVTTEKQFLRESVPYVVPAGYYMVFGDNRSFSSDSREWGPIAENAIVGKAWLRYWPLSKFGFIPHQQYSTPIQ